MDRRESVSKPGILAGKPAVKGTRISVELIPGSLAHGWTPEMILESYPQLAPEDIFAALAGLCGRVDARRGIRCHAQGRRGRRADR